MKAVFTQVWVKYAAALGVAAFVLVVVFFATHIMVRKTQVSPSPSIAPSPGQPGNPGDTAKSTLLSPTKTPAPTSTPVAGFSIDQFSVDQPQPGKIHIVSTLSGISAGTCKLTLLSADNQATKTNGEITFDGHYNICSFGTISVSGPGTWNATMSVTSANAVTLTKQNSFQVAN